MPINDALARYTGSLEKVDADFSEFARRQARDFAPEADWSEPELPRRATSTQISDWLKAHPKNYAAMSRLARQLINEAKWDDAKTAAETMLQLYPDDESASGPHALVAEICHEQKDAQGERAALEQLAELSDDDVDTLARLVELTTKAEDWKAVKKQAFRWLAVNPLVPAPHRALASAAESLHDDRLAIDSYRALLLLEPFDPADIHLQLASALERSGDLAAAKRHALLALEETPRYRAAHERLLAIVRKMEQNAGRESGARSQESARTTAEPKE
jgi:tetratricopeptide (TPR) repeat protein